MYHKICDRLLLFRVVVVAAAAAAAYFFPFLFVVSRSQFSCFCSVSQLRSSGLLLRSCRARSLAGNCCRWFSLYSHCCCFGFSSRLSFCVHVFFFHALFICFSRYFSSSFFLCRFASQLLVVNIENAVKLRDFICTKTSCLSCFDIFNARTCAHDTLTVLGHVQHAYASSRCILSNRHYAQIGPIKTI